MGCHCPQLIFYRIFFPYISQNEANTNYLVAGQDLATAGTTQPLDDIYIYCIHMDFCMYIYILMEKAMVPHSSTLAWKIPWMEEPGGLQSMGLLGVGHD